MSPGHERVAVGATGQTHVDGFNAPGIYGPTTVYQNSGNGVTTTLGTYFARGLAGAVTWSSTGFDGSVRVMTSNTFSAFGSAYVNPVLPSQTGTISATDGTTTYTLRVTMITDATTPTIAQGFFLDTWPIGTEIAGAANLQGPSYVSPDGSTTFNTGAGAIVTAAAVNAHYGPHTGTFTNNGVSIPLGFWFATELPPVASVVQSSQPYTNSPIGLPLTKITASSDAGICLFAISSPGNVLAVGATGQVTIQSALGLGPLAAVVTVTSPTGKTTMVDLNYNVAQGTNLAATNLTAALSAALDNSMGSAGSPGPVTVGTVTVRGIGNPTWTLTVLNDECQNLTTYGTSALNPRYVITPDSGNPSTATITANHLSAQIDQLSISATQGGTSCQNIFPLTIAAKSGPAVAVIPGATPTASVFQTWNAALDAFWTTPAAYQGMTLTLPGGTYSQTATDFSRTTIGHGSNQQWPPGPMTLRGPSPTNRTVLDFAFGAKGTGQGAFYAQGGDMNFANLAILHVSNMSYGEGNAGAIYKTNQLPYNCTIKDCLIYTSDMGPMNGDDGCHLVIDRCVLAHCGIGAGGLTHNFYAGHYSSIAATNVLSFGTAQVHEFKTRAARGTIANCQFVDGENGDPGASSCLDIPVGGQYTVTNTVFHKGPNPNNDGSLVQFCAEIVQNGPAWNVNTLELDGCTFINTCAPGALTSEVYGIHMEDGGAAGGALSPSTGLPATIIVKNCKFYNIPKSNWWSIDNPVNTVTDAGGNINVYEWPVDLLPVDPSTGAALTLLPSTSYANPVVRACQGLMVPPGTLQIRLPVNAQIGTAVTTLTGYDSSGTPLARATYSLIGSDGSNFAINAATGAVTVANTSIPDSLRWIEAAVSGVDSNGVDQTYSKFLFVVVGNGTLPGAPKPPKPMLVQSRFVQAKGSVTVGLTNVPVNDVWLMAAGSNWNGSNAAMTMSSPTSPRVLLSETSDAWSQAVWAWYWPAASAPRSVTFSAITDTMNFAMLEVSNAGLPTAVHGLASGSSGNVVTPPQASATSLQVVMWEQNLTTTVSGVSGGTLLSTLNAAHYHMATIIEVASPGSPVTINLGSTNTGTPIYLAMTGA